MTLKKRRKEIESDYREAKLTTVFLVLLIAFGIIINLFYLSVGMGYDDIWNYETALKPISKIYDAAPLSKKVPFYFISLKIWIATLGNQEYVLKLLNIFLGIVFVIFMYKTGKRIHSKEVGLLAAAISSISPILIHQTHQLDVYLMLMLFCIIGFFFLESYLKKRKRFYIVLAVIFSFLAIMTHTSGILFLIVEIAYIFFNDKVKRNETLFFIILAIIPALPFTLKSISTIITNASLLFSSQGKEMISFLPYPQWYIFLLAIVMTSIYGVIANRKKGISLFFMGIIPIALGLILSKVIDITYEHLIFAFPFMIIYLSLSISRMNDNRKKAILLFLIVCVSLYASWAYLSTLPDYGWKEASFRLKNNLGDKDIVIGSCYAERPLRYYANITILSLYNISLSSDTLGESDSVWVVYSPDWDCMWNKRKTEVENGISFIDSQCKLLEKSSIKEVIIIHYKC